MMIAGRGRPAITFFSGAIIGCIGGLIGLGGAEFRLPLLIGMFGVAGLEAVILNKAISLVVAAAALPFRASVVPISEIAASWPIIVNLLAGSLLGAWIGAGWATGLPTPTLYRIIAILLVALALVLVAGHGSGGHGAALAGLPLIVVGIVAGFAIGVIASLLGVAGGEFLMPTLVLLFGIDVKLAGSLSLAVSLPTMLVDFCAVPPGSQLRGAGGQRALRRDDGGGLGRGRIHRRPIARPRLEPDPAAAPSWHPLSVSDQDLEALRRGTARGLRLYVTPRKRQRREETSCEHQPRTEQAGGEPAPLIEQAG